MCCSVICGHPIRPIPMSAKVLFYNLVSEFHYNSPTLCYMVENNLGANCTLGFRSSIEGQDFITTKKLQQVVD